MQNHPRLIDPVQLKKLDSLETIIANQYLLEGRWVLKTSENNVKSQNSLSHHY